MGFDLDVCVVGGCGRVGLPLALVFTDRGMRVGIHDIDEETVAQVRRGEMPFLERGAESLLERALKQGLEVANNPDMIRRALYVVVVIGTPVDEHLNPRFDAMRRFFRDTIIPRLVEGQCVILRSTAYPGTTDKMNQLIKASEKRVSVAFCPERVAEGHALREMVEQPRSSPAATTSWQGPRSSTGSRCFTSLPMTFSPRNERSTAAAFDAAIGAHRDRRWCPRRIGPSP